MGIFRFGTGLDVCLYSLSLVEERLRDEAEG
jgi:hypothetical protein